MAHDKNLFNSINNRARLLASSRQHAAQSVCTSTCLRTAGRLVGYGRACNEETVQAEKFPLTRKSNVGNCCGSILQYIQCIHRLVTAHWPFSLLYIESTSLLYFFRSCGRLRLNLGVMRSLSMLNCSVSRSTALMSSKPFSLPALPVADSSFCMYCRAASLRHTSCGCSGKFHSCCNLKRNCMQQSQRGATNKARV